MPEEVGIKVFKKLVKNVVDYTLQVKKATADDGKISRIEYLGFIDEVIDTLKIAAKFPVLKAEILDFSVGEGKELVEYTISLGVVSGKAEFVIAHSVDAIEKAIGIWNDDIKPIIDVLKN